tara:strand:- start:54 stop:380 length:327 start_codon:yes stop_codon:yes gene_type:complete
MYKTKFIISISIFVSCLIITSTIKNETRILEKKIKNLNAKVLLSEKNLNEAQLDFYYLSSPQEIEKRLYIIGFDNYRPIDYSRIFLDISDFINIDKISNLNNLNEKKF